MESLRERYEAHHAAVLRESYLFRSGRKSRLELDEIDRRFADLSEGEYLEEAASELERASFADEREGWRRILRALEGKRVAAALRPLVRELRESEAAQRARVDGREQTLFAWQASLGSEPDAAVRRRIQDALDRGADALNPLREEHWRRSGELWGRLGYSTPRARAEALHPELDYDAWGARAQRLLEATQAVYRDGLARALAALGLTPEDATRSDAARVSALHAFDRFFPARRLLASLDHTTGGMGIRLEDTPGVTLDAEPRPGKHPRACCIDPRVPGEIYVVIAPRGGVDDYETLFHETGHALHFAFTSPSLPLERRILMDPALTETWAFLLHYRVGDPAWIAESPVADRAEAFERAARFRKLALLRRYAAKIGYELELLGLAWEDDPRPLAGLYAERLSAGTGYRYRDSTYLADTDPFFYSVDYFRAWCLEAQLAEHLREQFGRRFWRERRCGGLLKELWNTGGTYTPEQIASELGLGPIEVEPLIEELVR